MWNVMAATSISAMSCGYVDLRQPDCESTCGVRLYWDRPDGAPDCAEFDRAERVVLGALQQYAGYPVAWSCARLSGWRVYPTPEPLDERNTWYSAPHQGRIGGVTYCDSGRMVVNNADWFATSSYAHELAHAVQGCPVTSCPGVDDPKRRTYCETHPDWDTDGVIDAINAARSGQ